MNRKNAAAAAVLVAVFVLGCAAGGLAAHAWAEARYSDELMLGPGLRHEQRMLQGLTRRLELTDEQAGKVQALVAEHGATHRELMTSMDDGCFARMRVDKDRLDAAIRGLLTPEQQRLFDGILAQQAERFGHWGHRSGKPGRGPGLGRGFAPGRGQ